MNFLQKSVNYRFITYSDSLSSTPFILLGRVISLRNLNLVMLRISAMNPISGGFSAFGGFLQVISNKTQLKKVWI